MSEDDEKTTQEKYAHARVEEIMADLQQVWDSLELVKELLPNNENLDWALAKIDNIAVYWMQPLAAQMSYWTPSGEHAEHECDLTQVSQDEARFIILERMAAVRPEGYTDDEWLAFLAMALTRICGTKPRPV